MSNDHHRCCRLSAPAGMWRVLAAAVTLLLGASAWGDEATAGLVTRPDANGTITAWMVSQPFVLDSSDTFDTDFIADFGGPAG